MKKLVLFIILSIVLLAAVGFQRGWFQVVTAKVDEKTSVTVTVDKDKLHEDEGKAKAKLHDAKEQLVDEAAKHVK